MYFLAPQFLWLLPIVPGLVLLYLRRPSSHR